MDILTSSSFLQAFAALNGASLFLLTGTAAGMYIFSMPVIKSARTFTSAVMLHQFEHLITLGARYMQSSFYTQLPVLALLVILSWISAEAEAHERWTWFAVAIGLLVQTAWYEIVFVFPINDRLVMIKEDLKKGGNDLEADKKVRAEVLQLLGKWQQRHIGRIVLPFAAAVLIEIGALS